MVRQNLCQISCLRENANKTRYRRFPFDSELVRLKSVPYVNASWISDLLPDSPRSVVTIGPIMSSGPQVPNTCGDFWSMVWELGTRTVVMLCRVDKVSLNFFT